MGKVSGYLERAKRLFESEEYQDAFIFAMQTLRKEPQGKIAAEAACVALKANYHLGQYRIALRYGRLAAEKCEFENKIFPDLEFDLQKYMGLSYFRAGEVLEAYEHFMLLAKSGKREERMEGHRRIALMIAEIEFCSPPLLKPLEGNYIREDYTKHEFFTEPLKCLSRALAIAATPEEKYICYTDMGALLLQRIPSNNTQAAIRVFQKACKYASEENKPITLLRLGLAHTCGNTKSGIRKAKLIFEHIVKKHYIATGILHDCFTFTNPKDNPEAAGVYLMAAVRRSKKLMDVLTIWLASEIEKDLDKGKSIKFIQFVLEYFVENDMFFEIAQIFWSVFSTWQLDSKVVNLFEHMMYMFKARSLKKPGLKLIGRRF